MSCQIVIDLSKSLYESQMKDLKLVDSCNTTFGTITINYASMMESRMLPMQAALQNNWNKRKRFSSPMPRAKRLVTMPIQRMPPIQPMRPSFRQQNPIPTFQQNFNPQSYNMLPPRMPPVVPAPNPSPLYSKIDDDDVIEIEPQSGTLSSPVTNPNNASSNEVTQNAPVVQNISSVPIQNLSPVGTQNAHEQQQQNEHHIQNRTQPVTAAIRPRSMEQVAESSNATRAPPPQQVFENYHRSEQDINRISSERCNGNELSALPQHSEISNNDSSRLQNQQEPVVVEKQVNRSCVLAEGSSSSTHHQITSQIFTLPTVTSVATVQSSRNLFPSPVINPTVSATASYQSVNNSTSSTRNYTNLKNLTLYLNNSHENNIGTRMMNSSSTSNNVMTESNNNRSNSNSEMAVMDLTNPTKAPKTQMLNALSRSNNVMAESTFLNTRSESNSGMAAMDLTNPTNPTANGTTVGNQQQQQTPNLVPVQMSTNPPATNSPSSSKPDARETG